MSDLASSSPGFTIFDGVMIRQFVGAFEKLRKVSVIFVICMVPAPLCVYLRNPRLFSLTQHRLILIQLLTFKHMLHVSACT